MEGQQKISDFRKMLDASLASNSLSDKESIRELVHDQLQSSPSEVEEKRVTDLSDLVKLLSSASETDFKAPKANGASQSAWKLKQDREDYRVLYREGPHGSPLHTLLAEGYANAPVDISLCAGWEVSTYNTWWPNFDFPPFKVITACCLNNVSIDEHISLIRMKLPWPLSKRELILNYFLLELPEDGLFIVMLNSISDTETVNEYMEIFKEDQVPKAKDLVRMDLTGGFALKRITSNISYFRLVGNIDMKLEFVPQSLINFISRQLLGGGCRLFQKKVESEATGNGDFRGALEAPIYVRVREHLSRNNVSEPKPDHQYEESENQSVDAENSE